MDDSRAPNEHRADKDTLAKLKGEAPGILRWMVQGCLSYKKDVQRPPQSVLQVGEEYRRIEDK